MLFKDELYLEFCRDKHGQRDDKASPYREQSYLLNFVEESHFLDLSLDNFHLEAEGYLLIYIFFEKRHLEAYCFGIAYHTIAQWLSLTLMDFIIEICFLVL